MALKIVYKICCDIDVHKTFVVACIASTNDKGVTFYENYRFSTYTSGLITLLQLIQHQFILCQIKPPSYVKFDSSILT